MIDSVKGTHKKKINDLKPLSNVSKNLVYNFSKRAITESEEALLAKGPNYIISQQKPSKYENQVECEYIMKKVANLVDETTFKNIGGELKQIMDKHSKSYKNSTKNITTEEKKVFDMLMKNDDIVVAKADKVPSFVIMDRDMYFQKGDQFLNSKLFEKTQNVNQKNLKSMEYYLTKQRKGKLNDDIYQKIKSGGDRDPVAYFLPKIHKPDAATNLKVRPIVSTYGCYNYKMSKYLAETIRGAILGKSSSRVSDTFDFLKRIRELHLVEGDRMVVYDIENMYPSIPLKEVLPELSSELKNYVPISEKTLTKFLDFCTNDFSFEFNGNFYKQVNGVAMGTPIAPAISEYFLEKIDRLIVSDKRIKFYVRYVDDCFMVVSDKEKDSVDLFINKIHPNIKFIIDNEQQDKMHFMDVSLKAVSGSIETAVFRKACSPLLYTRFSSAQPRRFKRNLVKNMISRTKKICSNETIFRDEICKLRKMFVHSGYPLRFFNKQLRIFNKKLEVMETRREKEEEKKKIYMTLRYYGPQSEIFARKINNLFRNKLDSQEILISYKNQRKLVNAFSSRFKKKNISTFDSVYQIGCNGCDLSYIGQTERQLLTRIKEHNYCTTSKLEEKSSVAKHSIDTGHKINFDSPKILAHEHNTLKRTLLESFYMREFHTVPGNTHSAELSFY